MAENNNTSNNAIEWGETQRGIQSISIADPDLEQSTGVNNDPQGDTFGFGTPQLDLESIDGVANNDNLNIRLDFFTPIAPPSSFLPESVVGYIDLDLDQDPATGISSFQSGNAPPDQQGGPLGDEAFIDLFSESSGLVNLVSTTDFSTIAQIPK
jgi:serralysin